MTVKTFDIKKDLDVNIHVSELAEKHFALQLDGKKETGIRLSLKQAGCTGYKYVIDQVSDIPDDDVEVKLKNGISLYVDHRYVSAVRGLHIDLRKQGLNNNLVLENPNIKDECGCGESFSIEEINNV